MHLSIIIPVHNLENYIESCFESVYSQGVPEDRFEVICIDDGSSDRSLEVLGHYESLKSNLTVISQKNAGVSSARNRGIKTAAGKYVLFLDADDRLGEGSLSAALDIADRSTAEMIISRSILSSDNREKYDWSGSFAQDLDYSPQDLLSKGYFRGSACGCLFRREGIIKNNILFDETLTVSEDTVFMSECMAKLKTIRFFNDYRYLITERPGSASRRYEPEYLTRYSKALDSIDRILSTPPPFPPILHYAKYQLIIRISSFGNRIGLRGRDVAKLSGVGSHLPIRTEGIPVDRHKIALLNTSFTLFHFCIRLRDRGKATDGTTS